MIAVVGLGFVGLTVALSFAEKGVEVYGLDIDEFRRELIRNGKIPYFEPGLDDALARHIGADFHVVDDIDDVPDGVDCFFVCVGRPYEEGGKLVFDHIFAAIDEIVDAGFEDYYTIALKPSMIPGTMDDVIVPHLLERGAAVGKDMGIAFAPDFMREGKCMHDFLDPGRVVLGVSSERDSEILSKYFSRIGGPIISVSYKTAEFSKYMSSTFLATLISYANEMARVAKAIGDVDIPEAFRILRLDRRWGENTMSGYVYPSTGFGGVTLPRDAADFAASAKRYGADVKLLDAVLAINNELPVQIADEITSKADPDDKIGILGLSYKEASGDVRNSVSACIIDNLHAHGYKRVFAYDPIANDDYATAYCQDIEYCFSVKELCAKCDVIVIATPWRQFRSVLDYAKDKVIIDCRYLLRNDQG